MADKRIDELAQATQINDNDLFVLEQSGVAKKLAGETIKALSPTAEEKATWNGKQDTETITTTTSSTITLTPHNTTVVTNTPTSLDVTLAAPAVGVDFLCGLNFKAGAAFTLTETAPTGYAIVWEDEPSWTAGKVYEIIYRCLWLADGNGDTIISAKYSEVTPAEVSA